ncbi:MAG: hypothetical protein WCK90_02680 [archaeon]
MAEKKVKPTKTVKNKKEDASNKSISYFLMFLGGLAIVFLISYYAFNGIGKLSYQGLTFTEEKMGKINLWTYSYYFKDVSGQLYQYNLYLRNNPKTNKVPVYGDSIALLFNKETPALLGFDNTGLMKCSDGVLAASSISEFVISNQIQKAVGTTNMAEVNSSNYTYVSCEKYPQYNVILLKTGNETRVDVSGNCYTITANNCEILPATEKFIVQTLVDTKKRII